MVKRRCAGCSQITSNAKLCTDCLRGYRHKNNCVDCGIECSGTRCRKCAIRFWKRKPVIGNTGKCDDCGKVISENAKRCRACAIRAAKPDTDSATKTKRTKINRCKNCGARIETKRCYGCEIAEMKQRELETRKYAKELDHADRRIQEIIGSEPEPTQDAQRKSKAIPSHLRHKDIIY